MSDALWAVHIAGPDDICAAENEGAAIALAERINAWWATKKEPGGVDIRASVQPWPWSLREHRRSLAVTAHDFPPETAAHPAGGDG